MKRLTLAKGLELPADEAVTQKYGFIGRSGSGKSYAAMRLAELFLGAGAQVIALDWVGIWWSLRLGKDGKAPGFEHVYIFGGEHADVPLEPTSGALIADLVIDKHISVVLDVMHFRKAERTRFATAFAEQFFHRKKTARSACHLFIEEAQAYLPQMVRGDEARMVGVFEDIGKVGRNYGIGNSLISQRPQAINKDVLNQIEVLLAFQTNGPQERKTIAGWTAENTTAGAAMVAELPTLPVGDALVWSPQWLRLATRVHVSSRETYNASATPTGAAKQIAPKTLAKSELDALGDAIKATVEKQKADDPRELRKQLAEAKAALAAREKVLAEVDVRTKRIDEKLANVQTTKKEEARAGKIAELQQQLARHRRALESAMKILVKVKAIDFDVDTDEGRKALEQAVAAAVKQVTAPIEKRVTALAERVEGFKQAAKRAEDEITALLGEAVDLTVQVRKSEPFTVASERTPIQPPRPTREIAPQNADRSPRGNGNLAGGERKILTALAQYPDGRTKTQVAILTNYAHTGGGFNNYLSSLRSKGYLAGSGDRLQITPDGLAALGPYDPLPQGQELLDHWLRQIGKAERLVLQALADVWPKAMSKEHLGDVTGYEPSGGGFNNALSRLRSLELIEGRGDLKASDVLFD
jgi:hypothetical protein